MKDKVIFFFLFFMGCWASTTDKHVSFLFYFFLIIGEFKKAWFLLNNPLHFEKYVLQAPLIMWNYILIFEITSSAGLESSIRKPELSNPVN